MIIYVKVYLWTSYSLFWFFSIPVFVFIPVPQCFDYCSFTIYFEIRKCEPSHFNLFQSCFSYSGSLKILYELFFYTTDFSFSAKITLEFWLHWFCRLLWVGWTSYQHCLPVHEHEMSFHFLYILKFLATIFYSFQCIIFHLLV